MITNIADLRGKKRTYCREDRFCLFKTIHRYDIDHEYFLLIGV